MSLPSEHATRDLYFAALLLALDTPMVRTEKVGPRSIAFVFDITRHDLEAIRIGWANGTLTVGAQQFANAVKNLKQHCHSTTKEP